LSRAAANANTAVSSAAVADSTSGNNNVAFACLAGANLTTDSNKYRIGSFDMGDKQNTISWSL
jgi:hypothetical protein